MNQQNELLKGFEGLTDRESIDYQTKQWVEGNPLHNPIRDECTPDFSCCIGVESMMERNIRLKFAEARESGDEGTMLSILGMALSNVANSKGVKVHVSGENPTVQ